MKSLSRREWLALTGASGAGLIASACGLSGSNGNTTSPIGSGHLNTSWKAPTKTTTPGLVSLGLDPSRDGLRYVPTSYNPAVPAPLVLMLHGATGTPTGGMAPLRNLADDAGLVLLAPSSRDFSWDIRFGAFGADLPFIALALNQTFDVCNIDPTRIYIEGFSDGASYALSLGLSNGNLFRRIVAFSPGFSSPGDLQGKPPIFVSHGTQDTILPIDSTSRAIVPQLRNAGYDVTFQEFAGPHQVPASIASQAIAWLAAARTN